MADKNRDKNASQISERDPLLVIFFYNAEYHAMLNEILGNVSKFDGDPSFLSECPRTDIGLKERPS